MKLAVIVAAAVGLSSVQASAAEWTTIGKFGIKGIKPAAHDSTDRLATICISFDGPDRVHCTARIDVLIGCTRKAWTLPGPMARFGSQWKSIGPNTAMSAAMITACKTK